MVQISLLGLYLRFNSSVMRRNMNLYLQGQLVERFTFRFVGFTGFTYRVLQSRSDKARSVDFLPAGRPSRHWQLTAGSVRVSVNDLWVRTCVNMAAAQAAAKVQQKTHEIIGWLANSPFIIMNSTWLHSHRAVVSVLCLEDELDPWDKHRALEPYRSVRLQSLYISLFLF